MSHEYAMSRVKEALDQSEGNALKAQRLLIQWIEKDHSLLFGLITPHMQGIIAHAVNHVLNPAPKKISKKPSVAKESADDFGAELLKGLKGDLASFGMAEPKGLSKPGKASQAHVDAISKMIQANKGKGKTKK